MSPVEHRLSYEDGFIGPDLDARQPISADVKLEKKNFDKEV